MHFVDCVSLCSTSEVMLLTTMAYLLTYIALLWGYKLIMRKFPLILCNYRECFQVKSLVCKWEAINSFFFQPSFFLLFNSHLGSAVMLFVEFSYKKFSKEIGKKIQIKKFTILGPIRSIIV